jgi:hypothetical protein
VFSCALLFLVAEAMRRRRAGARRSPRSAAPPPAGAPNPTRPPALLPGVLVMLWTLCLLRPAARVPELTEILIAVVLIAFSQADIAAEVRTALRPPEVPFHGEKAIAQAPAAPVSSPEAAEAAEAATEAAEASDESA